MPDRQQLYLTDRNKWREWLSANFDKKDEVWLIYPKTATGKQRISYNDAVEEALCFGWIDSINKALDEDHTMQRFSPRNPASTYSQANKERLRWLAGRNMIHPSLVNTVNKIIGEEFVFPTDILNVIRQDNQTWQNYTKLSESYKRIRIAYIDSARKRPEEFEKRLLNFIERTKENKMIKGFGGIEKYY
jgi:uncharacterized protein YdeI (YjbR/CyaY-like superfamily)